MRLHSLHPRHQRAGLTLVEMMIALALSIFIMAILSEAFVKGLEVFGQYKALADLDQRLRTVANIIRRDLRAPHFENSKRLSECTVSNRPMPVLDGLRPGIYSAQEALALNQQLKQYSLKSPAQGFFSIEENANRAVGATTIFEGADASGRPSYRDQVVFDAAGNIIRSSDVLHFTSRLEGNDPDKFFYGKVRNGSPLDGIGRNFGTTRYDSAANNLFTSQAAELLYFLGRDETTFLPGVGTLNGPVLTFNLYRQAWLLVPDQYSNGDQPLFDNSYANTAAETLRFFAENDVSAFRDFSVANVPGMFFNTMASVQHRSRRRGVNSMNPTLPPFGPPLSSTNPVPVVRSPRFISGTGLLDGSDIMLTNVISFDVKVFDPFAYKIPYDAASPATTGPASGRGAYVDIGDVIQTAPTGVNPRPTAGGLTTDNLQPVFGGPINSSDPVDTFDTGTSRLEGVPGGTNLGPLTSRATHRYPITSIQITIRVFEPKSQQTRQITIIQDM